MYPEREKVGAAPAHSFLEGASPARWKAPTNIAYGGLDRRHLFTLASSTGSAMRARRPVPGHSILSHA
jgi:hypothetical protein